MDFLFDGVKEFSKTDFEKNRDLFSRLSNQQKPHTLFISCSDSRIVPNLLTKTNPGEIFVVRNVANIVPPYRVSSEYLSTTSAIEYAVQVLDVDNIIICGHSNCGGCKALFLEDKDFENIPHTGRWLSLARSAKMKAKELAGQEKNNVEIEWLVEQENIVEQMNHLVTYPFIKERYKAGAINIFGWYYEIGTGSVYNYHPEEKRFILIE